MLYDHEFQMEQMIFADNPWTVVLTCLKFGIFHKWHCQKAVPDMLFFKLPIEG